MKIRRYCYTAKTDIQNQEHEATKETKVTEQLKLHKKKLEAWKSDKTYDSEESTKPYP